MIGLRLTIPLVFWAALALFASGSVAAQTQLQQAPAGEGMIVQGETQTHQVRIDHADSATVLLGHDYDNLNLALVSPRGDVFDSTRSSQDGSWFEGDSPFGGTFETIRLRHPESGTWTVRVTAPRVVSPSGAAPYYVKVIFETRLRLEASGPEPIPLIGEPLRVKARLTNQGEPIRGAKVTALAREPDESTFELSFSDDGAPPDSAREDGVYTAEVKGSRTSIPGRYTISITATGHLPGTEETFERQATIEPLFVKSHSTEDFDDVWERRAYGPDEPPIEIRAHLERASKSGSYSYVYAISNGSPFPVQMFHIGRGHSTEEILSEPLGWEDTRNVPRSNYVAPPGWDLLFGKNNKGRGSLMWSTRDSTTALAPGQSLTFRVRVPRPDPTFERSHWEAFPSRSHGLYYGSLVATKEPIPRGNPIDRMGGLTLTRSTTKRDVAISFDAPEKVRLSVAILDREGQIIRVLTVPSRDQGGYRVVWDGRDMAHREVPSGNYFVFLTYGNTERYGTLSLDR